MFYEKFYRGKHTRKNCSEGWLCWSSVSEGFGNQLTKLHNLLKENIYCAHLSYFLYRGLVRIKGKKTPTCAALGRLHVQVLKTCGSFGTEGLHWHTLLNNSTLICNYWVGWLILQVFQENSEEEMWIQINGPSLCVTPRCFKTRQKSPHITFWNNI